MILSKDKQTLLRVEDKDIKDGRLEIPEGIKDIKAYACKENRTLKTIIFPKSLLSIKDWAFSRCTGVTELTLNEKLTQVGNFAFYGCTGVTELTLNENLVQIGKNAFGGCTGLTELTLNKNLTQIGYDAFSDCTGLTKLTLNENLTQIGSWAFSGCSGLTELTLNENLTQIGGWAFSSCTGLTKLTLNENLTQIGVYAFNGCNKLSRILIDSNDDEKIARVINLLPKNLRNKVISKELSVEIKHLQAKALGWHCSYQGLSPLFDVKELSHIPKGITSEIEGFSTSHLKTINELRSKLNQVDWPKDMKGLEQYKEKIKQVVGKYIEDNQLKPLCSALPHYQQATKKISENIKNLHFMSALKDRFKKKIICSLESSIKNIIKSYRSVPEDGVA